MDGAYVEFYITCNPPLLPSGVEYVIQQTQDLVDAAILPEILYEPDVPWFKCIAATGNKEKINEVIQETLLSILEEETSAIDTNITSLIDVIDNVAQPDIDILAEDPRVMTWSNYKSQDGGFIYSFNKYRFPETMMPLNFKTTWRGIEEWSGGTLENLLVIFSRLVKDKSTPITPDEFGELTNCQISYNMKESMIYLGTDESVETLQLATRKLQNLLTFVTSNPRQEAHLIALEGDDPLKVVYKWMSHIGLSRTTYVQVSGTSMADEYRLLLNAATLRTQVLDKHSRWVVDRMVYPNQVAPGPTLAKPFRPFEGYVFRAKEASTDFQAVQKSQQVLQKPAVPALPLAPGMLRMTVNNSTTDFCNVPSGDQSKSQKQSAPDRDDKSDHDKSPEEGNDLIDMADAEDEAEDQLPDTEEEPQPGTTFNSPPVDEAFINSWRASVRSATMEESHEPSSLPDQTEDLISFDVQPEAEDETKDGNAYEEVDAKVPIINPSEDLIYFGSEPEQDVLDCGLEREFSALKMSDNIFNTQVIAGVAHQDDNPVISFGLQEDEANEFFETMRQKASRDTSRANRGGSRQVSTAAAWMGSWSGSGGARGHPGGAPNPITPIQETNVNAEWPTLGAVPPSPKKRKNATYSAIVKANNPHPLTNNRSQQIPSKAPPAFQPLADAPALQPPSVKQDDHVTELPAQRSEILQDMEFQIKDLARVLPFTPGNISLEAKFGRIYLKQFSPTLVCSSEGGPSFKIDETLEFLNAPNFRQDLVGFSSILTTVGEEANNIVAVRQPGEPQWHPFERQTWYDFVCTFNDSQRPFIVEVEANMFRYTIREQRQESFAVYLHCPHRAWDVKICATRSSPLEEMPRHRSFAEALIASMSISDHSTDGIIIGTPGAGKIEGRVENIKIRQVAKYRQKRQGSELVITAFTTMEETTTNQEGSGTATHRRKIWSRRSGNGNGAIPCRWFEAAISSPRAQTLFDQNKVLEFGQRASWDVQQLENDGILQEICQPALSMAASLDLIGCTNNNEQRLDARDAFHNGLMEQKGKKVPFVFW
ncbi:hypothetical protein PT974_08810 [Cladobotryum mycophilum]|uniref:Uncharacterized protein n=1 Tax=Cladobotryum mycophilum TaxID=491253 RepID=A0ABR0SFC9_9HYPO